MALSQDTHVYMETMEETKNEDEKSYEVGDSRILCAHGGKQPQRTLVQCKSNNGEESHVKRKTDKLWLL